MYNTIFLKNDTLGNVLSDLKSMISCIYVRDIYKKQVKTALVELRRFYFYKWFCSSQAIHAAFPAAGNSWRR